MHKEDVPFRVIISERGTWQKQAALYLVSKLNVKEIDDQFLVKGSDESLILLGFTAKRASRPSQLRSKNYIILSCSMTLSNVSRIVLTNMAL